MSFIEFEKAELVNLEYSLFREMIRSNRAGSYASTTIIGCNTRKYHGLLVCPLEEMGGQHHVLLSTLDATLIQHDKAFNLGIHKYEGDHYVPKGHKYVRDFDATKGSYVVYRVGGVVLSREILLVSRAEQVLVKYTLLEAHSDTILRLTPFLAFREQHALSKSNLYVNTRYGVVENGISSGLYEGYPDLYMQCSKKVDYVSVPDWYYNVEYMEEQKRGYEYKEDLFVPGYFEMPIKKGESIVFSAGTSPANPDTLKRKFSQELKGRIPKDSMQNCLLNAAEQLVVHRKGGKTDIIKGFPWLDTRGRDTFMALPGLTMSTGNLSTALKVVDTMVTRMKKGIFPDEIRRGRAAFQSADAPLWFIWALQQYQNYDPDADLWMKYRGIIKKIMETYRSGFGDMLVMTGDGLVQSGMNGKPLTWMNAEVHGIPVTPRAGKAVEVNALWYNAVCQVVHWSEGRDTEFHAAWAPMVEKIRDSFNQSFWDAEEACLVDVISHEGRDQSIRPNQILAASMDHSPLDLEKKKAVIDLVEQELLTPRGLRTLSPRDEAYKGIYEGDVEKRDRAFHQGTVWAWLLEHFSKAYLDVYKRSGLSRIKTLYEGFEEELSIRGLGSISQVFDGNPPHTSRGGISQATGVAALIRMGEMIDSFNQKAMES